MFLFVVRHFRWLSRIPGAPHVFDALLLAFTCVAHPPRIAAMELLEREATKLPDISLQVHRLGGCAFVRSDGKEAGHVHGHALLDVRLHPFRAAWYIDQQIGQPHHVFPIASGWISYQLHSPADVPRAITLLMEAV
jgi:hypothetical protein